MTNNKLFENICRMSQVELKRTMTTMLKKKYKEVHVGDGYVFAKGSFPVCLVAHLDTVHSKEPVTFVYSNGKMASPEGIGGDDRCGIYMIMNIIKKFNCSVLFCEDEEIGCVGARKFIKTELAKELEFNYMIELDRKGSTDAVFYDCDNEEFEEFITKDGDWKTQIGIYSDISHLAPFFKCAAVNFSCGYYNAHTKDEYVVLAEMENNIEKVCKVLERTTEEDKFEYIELQYNADYYNKFYGSYYGSGYYNSTNYKTNKDYEYNLGLNYPNYTGFEHYYSIIFNINNEEDSREYYANSDFEALGMFFVDYPSLCYDDVVAIEDWGEDAYNI